jgi:uncharacterized Tic20 family protein
MSADATSATVLPSSAAAAFTQPAPGALPATYVEADAAQISQAKIAHFLGIFGILGTGIYYIVKKNDGNAGPFVRDQMKEAFNFHLLVFCVNIALSVVGAIAAALVGSLAVVFSLASFALLIGAIVLSILNGLKAGKGQVARYPARLSVLK